MSFASSRQIQNKLMGFLPCPDDFMTLTDYNKAYLTSLAVQTDKDGISLPQKEQLEEQHRAIVQGTLQAKLQALKVGRNKNKSH